MGKDGRYIINFNDLDVIIVTLTNNEIARENEMEIPTLEIVSDFILKAL